MKFLPVSMRFDARSSFQRAILLMRQWPACSLAGLLLTTLNVFTAQAANSPWRLEFLSDLNIPTGTPYEAVGQATNASVDEKSGAPDLSREGVLARKASGVFGGISAIAFDPASSTLYALSDSSTPTIFPFTLAVSGGRLRLEPKSLIRLGGEDGSALPVWTVDPEGIVLSPAGSLLIASEGYVARIPPVLPAVMEFSIDGSLRRQFPIPEKFLPADSGKSARGVRVNKGFESLTLSPDAKRLYTATEHPLQQDNSGCGLDQGCVVRLLEFAMDEDDTPAVHEYLYELDPLTAPSGFAATTGSLLGLPDLLSLGGGEMFGIERGFLINEDRTESRNRIRIQHLNVEGATDILNTTEPRSKHPGGAVRKSLVLDLDDILDQLEPGFQRLDNLEGICFGPLLEDGSRTILLVSDNNFSSRQRTVFLLFRLVRG
jgi:3-phytase